MAYVTPIGRSREQADYRLNGGHGCTPSGSGPSGDGASSDGDGKHPGEPRFTYRTDGRERPLMWIGEGLREVGIEPGSELTPEQFDQARALLGGADPRTGETLVAPKLAVPDDAKVSWAPLLRSIESLAAEADVTAEQFVGHGGSPAGLDDPSVRTGQRQADSAVAMLHRAQRAVASKGEAGRVRADDAGVLVDWLGLNPEQVWAPGAYAAAVDNLHEIVSETDENGTVVERRQSRRVAVGNAGYDVTFTLPKSHSMLLAFAEEDTAAAIENTFMQEVQRTFAWLEGTTCYGMRGQHGRGSQADTVSGSGYLGWTMVHRAARPTGGAQVGDPHWHVHLTVANMTRGTDGQWSTIAAGGRDLMRHASAVDHVVKALTRRQLAERFGIGFERNTRSGAWEIVGIPDETLVRFSKRQTDVHRMLEKLGYDDEKVSAAQKRVAQHRTRGGKTEATSAPDATLQEIWQDEERTAGGDPAGQMRAVFGRSDTAGASQCEPDTSGPGAGDRAPGAALRDPGQRADLVADIAAQLQHVKTGATSHARRFTRADALWRVADACPEGVADVAELETLTDEVLTRGGFVALPDGGGDVEGPNGQQHNIASGHMANAASYTTDDVLTDETTILDTAAGVTADQSPARVDLETAAMGMAIAEAQHGYALSDEQTTALLRLVTEGRAVDAVEGAPGTGKTTLMSALRVVLEAGGFVVRGAATAAVAAHNLQAESGIGAVTAETILQSLRNEQSPLSGVDMLVLDEANLTDDRDRAQLYRHAHETGTRIVEIGDAKQLRGVGVGSLFGRVHQTVDGCSLTQNRRQHDEDERAAVAAWRDGDYMAALSSWGERGHLTVTQTSSETIAAMLACWARERRGAADAHQQIRGLVMLAATNDAVARLNESAQAMRRAEGELGDGREYRLAGGSAARLHVGDHVTMRVNDRAHHDVRGVLAGPTVLNGYRGVISAIDEAGNLTVEWEHNGGDGTTREQAVLTPEYVARGGLSLGYAMTIHKAEGLTVGDQWSDEHGEQRGGTVLFHATGADNPGMHVASSRHRAQMQWYTSLDDITPAGESTPRVADPARRWQLAAESLADRARNSEHSPDDTPVLAELWPQQYGQPAEHDRDADDAARPRPEPEVDEEQTQRETDGDAQRQREEQAAAERRAWAIALLEELWGDDDRALIARVSGARGLDRFADALASLEGSRGDVRDVLATMSRAPLGRDDLRDPASYAARTVYATAERMDARAAAEAEWHASRDQAADLLRETWAGRPQLAERVIDGDAFDAVVRQLSDGVNAGFDVHELLARVPVETVDDAEIRNPAAFTAWAVGQAQREVAHAQQAAEPADAPVSEQLAAQLSQTARDWAHQPTVSDTRPEQQQAPDGEAAARAGDINAAAAAYYRTQLDGHPQAREYLQQRVGDLEAAQQRFTLGYAPPGWRGVTDHLRTAGYADRDLLEAGISTETKDGRLIDRFRDRVLVGMHDHETGRLAGFIGRPPHENYPAETPKYLNTPASATFDKSRVVFGLAEQRDTLAGQTTTPVLVEGPFDALALAAEPATDGRIAPLATSGTAVTEQHLAAIRAHAGSDQLVIALDGDQAGQAAAAKTAQHALATGGDTRVAVLPDGHDPASWLAAHRDEPHQALQPYLDPSYQHEAGPFVADAAIDRYFAAHPEQHRDEVEGRLAAADVAAKTLRHADLQTATDTGMHVADRLGVDAGTVAGLIAEHSSGRSEPAPTTLPDPPHPAETQPQPTPAPERATDHDLVPSQQPAAQHETTGPAAEPADAAAVPSQVEDNEPASWRQREFGAYDAGELDEAERVERRRVPELEGQSQLARQKVDRLETTLADGPGPERQTVDNELTQLRTRAEAISAIERLESERAGAVRTASEAGRQRAAAEQDLEQAGPFTRKAPLQQAVDEARERETTAYNQARSKHEEIAEHEPAAGPANERRAITVRARAAEKDYPNAAERADHRDQIALQQARADAQERTTRAEASHQRADQLRAELDLRAHQTEAQRTAEHAQRLEARAAAVDTPAPDGPQPRQPEPGTPQPGVQPPPPEPPQPGRDIGPER